MDAIRETTAALKVGEPIRFRELALFPLFDGAGRADPDYLTLDEALVLGTAKVTETSRLGRVSELRVVNDGRKPVLLVEGEELRGGKQNRVVGVTVLVPALHVLTIPVLGVEGGRWLWSSEELSSSPTALYASGRAALALLTNASSNGFEISAAAQAAALADIDDKARRLGSLSPTGNMAEIFESQRAALEEFQAAFEPLPGQCGMAFAVCGQLLGLDLFHHPDTLARLFRKLLYGYALDCLDPRVRDAPGWSSPESARRFVEACGSAPASARPSLGHGQEVRLSGEKVGGGALVFGERVLHLSAFALG